MSGFDIEKKDNTNKGRDPLCGWGIYGRLLGAGRESLGNTPKAKSIRSAVNHI